MYHFIILKFATLTEYYEVIIKLTCPAYNPTPVQEIRLKGLMLSQQQRIYLNVGGTKFETVFRPASRSQLLTVTYGDAFLTNEALLCGQHLLLFC